MAKEEEQGETLSFFQSPMGKIAILGFCLTMLIASVFAFGAYYSCHKGQGTLDGLTCVNPKDVGFCSDFNKKYKVPNNTSLSYVDPLNLIQEMNIKND